jgi:hypothetical protein
VQAVVVEPPAVLDEGQLELGPAGPQAVSDEFGLEALGVAPTTPRARGRRR